MASIVLVDGQVTLNAFIFSKTRETEGTSEHLNIDSVAIVSGTIEKDDYRDVWQLIVNKVENIDIIKEKYAKSFDISLNNQHIELLFDLIIQSDWALSLILFQYGGEFFKQFYVLIVE
jgi:DNA polymerase-3 subunit alpha